MLIAAGELTVPTPGTRVAVSSLTALIQYGLPRVNCHGILFQALDDNTGKITISQRVGTSTTYRNLAVLGIPTTSFIPSFSVTLTKLPEGVGLLDLYVDAANAEEGVLVDVLVE